MTAQERKGKGTEGKYYHLVYRKQRREINRRTG